MAADGGGGSNRGPAGSERTGGGRTPHRSAARQSRPQRRHPGPTSTAAADDPVTPRRVSRPALSG